MGSHLDQQWIVMAGCWVISMVSQLDCPLVTSVELLFLLPPLSRTLYLLLAELFSGYLQQDPRHSCWSRVVCCIVSKHFEDKICWIQTLWKEQRKEEEFFLRSVGKRQHCWWGSIFQFDIIIDWQVPSEVGSRSIGQNDESNLVLTHRRPLIWMYYWFFWVSMFAQTIWFQLNLTILTN